MLLHFTKISFQGNLTVTQILLEPSCVTWDTSFNCRHGYTSLCATPCISVKLHYYYLSYKLRCLRRIYIPEKIRNNTHVRLISLITADTSHAFRFNRLSRHSVRLMNVRQSLHRSQSKVICQNFLDYGG